MVKRVSALFLAIGFLVLTLASACASGAGGVTELSVVWWGSQPRHDYTTRLLNTFSEMNPRVVFEGTGSGFGGYFEKLATQSAAGTLPDIIQMDYAYLNTYAKYDTLLDLRPYVEDGTIDLSGVEDSIAYSADIGGKLLGIPLSCLIPAYSYNPQELQAAGMEVPPDDWTWEDFETMCVEFTNKTGKFANSTIQRPGAMVYFQYWVRQHGATIFSEDGASLGYDDDNVFAGYADMLLRLQEAGAIPSPDEWIPYDALDDPGEPLVVGEGLGTMAWMNFPNMVRDVNPNLKLHIPPNSSTGNKGLWVKPAMLFSISKNCADPKMAAKFINWFINDIDANKVIMAERGVPVSDVVRKAIKSELTPLQQDMFAYADVATTFAAKIDPPDPAGSGEIVALLDDCVNQVLYGKKTSAEAAAEFREKANEILERNAF